MLKRLILATSMGLAMLLVPATSQASTIPYNCATCGSHNTAFDITYSVIDPALNTYEVTVTAWYQPAGAGTMDYAFINAISLKLEGLTYDTPSLISEPVGGGPWEVLDLGLTGNGCAGNGNGFFCADSAGAGASAVAGGSDTWVFRLELSAPLGDTQQVTFKGHFVNMKGDKVEELAAGVYTATADGFDPNAVAAVPEPASLVLMGAGLSVLAMRLRKRA